MRSSRKRSQLRTKKRKDLESALLPLSLAGLCLPCIFQVTYQYFAGLLVALSKTILLCPRACEWLLCACGDTSGGVEEEASPKALPLAGLWSASTLGSSMSGSELTDDASLLEPFPPSISRTPHKLLQRIRSAYARICWVQVIRELGVHCGAARCRPAHFVTVEPVMLS